VSSDPQTLRAEAFVEIGQAIETNAGLLIERDIAVRLRDGVRIYVDIYRPDGPPGEKDLPVIIGWGPYGKHTVGRTYSRESGVRPEWVSKYTGFEGVNPLYWCPRGYASVSQSARHLAFPPAHHDGITEAWTATA
jgi:predicted acyl esterase